MNKSNGTTRSVDSDSASVAPATMPSPAIGERPTLYADRVGEWYAARTPDTIKRRNSFYRTPVAVADFMAAHTHIEKRRIRILDPAAGAGILCCAAVESLLSHNPKIDSIELVAYEIESNMSTSLQQVMHYLSRWIRSAYGVSISISVTQADFILEHSHSLTPNNGDQFNFCHQSTFDLVVSNPPYFKIKKSDPRALAAQQVVHGQPNIYSFFMAISATLLDTNGKLVYITPRSFTSGAYFRRFRKFFFNMVRPLSVHVFESRRDAFKREEVLQENIIIVARREPHWHRQSHKCRVTISSSQGIGDIDRPSRQNLALHSVLDVTSSENVFRLPISEEDSHLMDLIDAWPCTLGTLGLAISTGPVVAFRATRLIGYRGLVPHTHVPLYWMNHVRPMEVTWPIERHKPEYIRKHGAESLLVKNQNYVLLRRFSAKEELRRLTAAPYIANVHGSSNSEVGFENHLNYIHRPDGELTEDETWGLAAIYNSRLLDRCFRCINGSTQVNATELRSMRLPSHDSIVRLGNQVKNQLRPADELDRLVSQFVALPSHGEVTHG